jgi:hypothetical protein
MSQTPNDCKVGLIGIAESTLSIVERLNPSYKTESFRE